jgi:hypothetical protein
VDDINIVEIPVDDINIVEIPVDDINIVEIPVDDIHSQGFDVSLAVRHFVRNLLFLLPYAHRHIRALVTMY